MMVVTTVADCCSTLMPASLPPLMTFSALRTSSSSGQRLAHHLQLLLHERADFGGAAEPIGDRRRQQRQAG